MSQIPNNQESQSARVHVTRPAAGVAAVVASRPGQQFAFDFDLADAPFTRSENNLVIQAGNGASVTLCGYFAVDDESLPNLVLADGSVVSGNDFLARFSDLDISTAVGPAKGMAKAKAMRITVSAASVTISVLSTDRSAKRPPSQLPMVRPTP